MLIFNKVSQFLYLSFLYSNDIGTSKSADEINMCDSSQSIYKLCIFEIYK